jgi:preprotein translocase subunit YajC
MQIVWENVLTSSIVFIVFCVAAILFYYLSNRGRVKKRKEHFAELHKSLAEGKKVVFAGGLYGVLKAVRDDTVDIKVKSGAIIEVSRYAISEIVE